MSEPEIILKEVLGKDGSVLIYDVYVDGKWIGSRRQRDWGLSAAKTYLESLKKK